MRPTVTVVCLSYVLLGLAGCGGGGDDDGGDDPVIQVTVAPSKAVYALGEEVRLTITLENVGSEGVAVSTADAALRITSLTRDAVVVAGATSTLKSEQDLVALVDAGLVTLAPGEQTTIVMTSVHTGVPDGQVLAHEQVGATDLESVAYSLGAAGLYEIGISYRFQGANPDGLTVLSTEAGPGAATFTVVP